MTGAVEIGYMEKSVIPLRTVVQVPDQASAIGALQADRVHAITMTGPSLQAMLDSASDESIERVADFEQPVIDGESVRGYGATAFAKRIPSSRRLIMRSFKMKESGEAGNFAEVRVQEESSRRDDGRRGNSMPNSWIDFLPAERGGDHD